MISHSSPRPASALRARMIEDMNVRGFSEKTRNDYIRNVRAFAAFIGRSPDTATAEDLRRFQLHQTQSGMQPPSVNSAVSALRFTDAKGCLEPPFGPRPRRSPPHRERPLATRRRPVEPNGRSGLGQIERFPPPGLSARCR